MFENHFMHINDILTSTQIKTLLKINDRAGAWALVKTWGLMAFLLTIASLWKNPWVWMGVVIFMGGQQLALAILMHEASHSTLFSNKKVNDFFGQWFCSLPLWLDLTGYRKHHLDHHRYTWTQKDPDLGLAKPYPVSGLSFTRKILRDLTGLTGLKAIYGYLLRDFGFIEFTISNKVTRIDQTGRTFLDIVKTGLKKLTPFLLVQIIFFGFLKIIEHTELYFLWWGAYLTTFQLFIRLRAIAEHAVIGNPEDDWQNTRTTKASWISHLFLAPHHVNYHLEHHLLMTVPQHSLPKLHNYLVGKNIFNDGNSAPSYFSVFRKALIS